MQVTLEKPEQGLENKIIVRFSAEELDKKVEQRLNEMRRNIKMDGFRPGKVPASVVKKRYGNQVRQELLGETIQKAFYDAVEQEGVQVAGYPMFDDLKEEDGNIEFVARFETLPEIILPNFSELEVETMVSEVTDADIDAMIEKLQEQRAAWRPDETKVAEEGDQVIASFVGRVDGEEFEGGKAEDVPIILGSGRMIPGFEEQLVGIQKGETKTIKVTFPEDYQAENLKGKEAEFDVTAHSVQTKEMPEIEEAFIKSLGIEEGTEEALRNEIKVNIEREIARATKQKNRENVFETVEKEVEVEIPNSMIQQETEALMNRAVQELQQQGIKPEQVNLTADSFKDEAEKRAKLGLILGQIVKEGNIQVTDQEVTDYLTEQASAYEDPQEVIAWYQQNPQALAEVKSIIMEDKVAQSILDKAKVKEVKKTFDEVIKPA